MGFTLKYNIFRPDAREQRAFQRFPIQVAVLFSPSDTDFSGMLSEMFLRLDQLTGQHLVFFATLDPPSDWLNTAKSRPEWISHERNSRKLGFSCDDSVLVYEIARLFGVGWASLPSLVVATNLWHGDLLITPTNPWHFERQITLLTDLARELVEPDIDQIAEALEDSLNFSLERVRSINRTPNHLQRFYEFLDTAPQNPRGFAAGRFHRLLDWQLSAIQRMFSAFRGNNDQRGRERDTAKREHLDEHSSEPSSIDDAFESVAEEARGSLVAPSTVAMKVMRSLHESRNREFIHDLDEESRIMIETSLRHANLLEHRYRVQANQPDFFTLTRPPNYRSGKDQSVTMEDFTPGAQGIWKALELEINLSIIQAARTSRGVKMPEYFTYHDPNLPKDKGRVLTLGPHGKPRFINTPVFDGNTPRKHRFLSLGDAYHVTEAMLSRHEDLGNVIRSCLRAELPREVLDGWKQVARIRNPVSHTRALRYEDYESVLNVMSDGLLRTLVTIKRKMSHRNV